MMVSTATIKLYLTHVSVLLTAWNHAAVNNHSQMSSNKA